MLERYGAGERCFVDAELSNARLVDENLSDVDLTAANLFAANLTGAILHNVVLDGAILREATLFRAQLKHSQIRNADLYNCRLCNADLSNSDLRESDFWCADLDGADLADTDLSGASLRFADLKDARLERATLTNVNLIGAQLVDTVLDGADISGSRVYGVSAWSVSLVNTTQLGLIITDSGEPTVTVDDLEVSQFVFMLLRNERMRKIIDTVTSKVVLILGRFTPRRKAILDQIRDALRSKKFVPIMFDFARSEARDFTETIKTLAGMSRFVIADITNPKSNPLELQAVVPDYMIPFVPILERGEEPFSMLGDLQGKYDWVLDVLIYDSVEVLLDNLERAIIMPALDKHEELMVRKAKEVRMRDIQDCSDST